LRRFHPDWALSVADVLQPHSCRRAVALQNTGPCDLLLLNPPFSLHGAKRVSVEFEGEATWSSVAMAHIMRSLTLFEPRQGAIAIVPESLMFSDTDALAREKLSEFYSLEVIESLPRTTFFGVRANALVVRLSHGGRVGHTDERRPCCLPEKIREGLVIVRGGLPRFEASYAHEGLPYVHTTDFRDARVEATLVTLPRVTPIGRGVVTGSVILVPRVGLPKRATTMATYLRRKVQLSDCVIAIRFPSIRDARACEAALHKHWESFEGLYRGTGARYVTVHRLERWLAGS